MPGINKQIALKQIGIGIIGSGSIAETHLKSIQELENCRAISMASSTPKRAETAQAKHNIPVVSDYHLLLKNPEIQAVIICTNSGNHLEPTLAAAEAGKHVLVEKPMEVTMDRARQMIQACEAADVQLSCIFQNRFSSDFIRLKNAVSKGKFGRILLANAFVHWYRSEEYYSKSSWKGTLKGDGGAAFINQGIHTIDLLLNLMGKAESVFAKVKTVLHDIEGEDLGAALVSFKNGALGSVHASTALWPGYPERIEIFGDNGSALLEAGKITQWNIKGEMTATLNAAAGSASGSSDPKAINYQLHKAQINNFVQSILNGTPAAVSGDEGLAALEIILKIYESSIHSKEINF